MDFIHSISEKFAHLKIIRWNCSVTKSLIRCYDEKAYGDYTFKPGSFKYLKQIAKLHGELFPMPLLSWLYWIYLLKSRQLCSVAVDRDDNLIAYDLYLFEKAEYQQNYIHELYLGVRKEYQHQGIAVQLRLYSAASYDNGSLSGISTLAAFNNISALRSAQKAGFGIIKESVKPRAYYMFKPLRRR